MEERIIKAKEALILAVMRNMEDGAEGDTVTLLSRRSTAATLSS